MDLKKTNSKDQDKRNRRAMQVDLTTMVFGKVPPQAKDLEECILGAIMIQKDAYDVVAEKLTPEAFYVEAHQRIFKAIKRLAQKSQPIDILTVAEELRSSEELEMVGGAYYVTKLTNSVVSAANIDFHCKIILQKFIQREIIRVSGELINSAYEEGCDSFDLLDYAEEQLSLVGMHLSIGDMVGIDTVLVEAIQKIQEWRHLDSDITGVPTLFRETDKATRGWQDGDLIILAARPSVGKTAFALNIAKNAALYFQSQKQQKSVALWSLEMKSVMLVLRLLAAESKQLLYKIQTGKLTDDDMRNIYKTGVQVLSQLKIFFDDSPGLTLTKLRSKARKLKRKNQLGLIIIDYLQLMSPDERSGNREQEVSKISRSLKNLAVELSVPIIALSQLSREVEKRVGARAKPQLSDLRESGALEQDADVVMFLYGPTEEEILKDPNLLNRRYLRIAKQRNGVLITEEFSFKDEIQFFEAVEKVMPSLGLGSGSWRPVETRDYTEPTSAKDEFQDPDNMPF